jgi:hypothetical protein
MASSIRLAKLAINEMNGSGSPYEDTPADNWLITVSYGELLTGDESANIREAMARRWNGAIRQRDRTAGVSPAWDGFLFELIRTGSVSEVARQFISQLRAERVGATYVKTFELFEELIRAINLNSRDATVRYATELATRFGKRKQDLGDTTMGGTRMSDMLTDIRLASALQQLPIEMKNSLPDLVRQHIWRPT